MTALLQPGASTEHSFALPFPQLLVLPPPKHDLKHFWTDYHQIPLCLLLKQHLASGCWFGAGWGWGVIPLKIKKEVEGKADCSALRAHGDLLSLDKVSL